ncbi:MAG TPA: aspartate aminotransferase family protein, partial [Solirubrobacteraceae bacterium]
REVCVSWLPGLLTVFFAAEVPGDFAAATRCDTAAFGAWCRALLERGVYPPPSQFEAWFPSLAHSDAQIERTIEAARGAFEALA